MFHVAIFIACILASLRFTFVWFVKLAILVEDLSIYTHLMDERAHDKEGVRRKKFRQNLGLYYAELRRDPERDERETKEDSEWLLGTILTDDWNEADNDPSNW
jgi:hypothetical protein